MARAIITSAPLNASIVVALLAIAAAAPAAAAGYYQSAGGMAIYVRVVPAATAQRHAPEHPESTMHGGAPAWGEQYHIAVTLFDLASRERIRDANVNATVFDTRQPGKRLPGPQKELEPMPVAGALSYGNYFNMPAPAPYRIELEIQRRDAPEIAKASFEYRHAVVATKPRR